jgi:hypothetical protein
MRVVTDFLMEERTRFGASRAPISPQGTPMAKKPSASSQREKLLRKRAADIRDYAKTPEYKAEIQRLKAMPDPKLISDIRNCPKNNWRAWYAPA